MDGIRQAIELSHTGVRIQIFVIGSVRQPLWINTVIYSNKSCVCVLILIFYWHVYINIPLWILNSIFIMLPSARLLGSNILSSRNLRFPVYHCQAFATLCEFWQRRMWFMDTRWRHDMETLSALLNFCEGNPPKTGGILSLGSLMCSLVLAWTMSNKQSSFSMIWDAQTLMWLHCNDFLASPMSMCMT